ncbi:DMT family transporter [Cellulomonas sp. URHB0016]
MTRAWQDRGVRAALFSALLFGAGTPLAKLLLGDVSPWMLAGLLYVGSGAGLWAVRLVRRSPRVRMARGEVPYLAGAVLAGGILGPVLLMLGLSTMPASGASLLLNAEGVLTAVIAWVVFRENADRRVVAGMGAIVAGAVVLSLPGSVALGGAGAAAAILGACLCWAVDNNLTRRVSLTDATWLAAVKGSVAGPVNVALALVVGSTLPPLGPAVGGLAVGFVAYGLSLVLFIVGLRHVGTARAGAYFSVAPFFGAALAVTLGDPVTWQLVLAGALMAVGTWLHLTEHHEHPHTHEHLVHDHWHTHDEHHQHEHDEPVPAGTRHRHEHVHGVLTHTHAHFPDVHHRHAHRQHTH